MDTDTRRNPPKERPRRFSTTHIIQNMDPDEVDPVVVKPSTELIPDEYEHTDNKKGLVLIFHSEKDENNAKKLKKALEYQGYKIPSENVYPFSTREYVMDGLQKVSNQDHRDKTCLVLIIMGNAHRIKDEEILPDKETGATVKINDVWPFFATMACPSLRYKPKIILFQATKRVDITVFDAVIISRRASVQYGNYDVPAEADMLLIFHAPEEFVEDLCQGIVEQGKRDDIMGLVTSTKHAGSARRPLLISTLTSKFFFVPSDKRGHHHDLHENFLAMDKMVKELNGKKDKLTASRVFSRQTSATLSGVKPKAPNKREGVADKAPTKVNKPSGNASRETKEKPRTYSSTTKKQATTAKKEGKEAAKSSKV